MRATYQTEAGNEMIVFAAGTCVIVAVTIIVVVAASVALTAFRQPQ